MAEYKSRIEESDHQLVELSEEQISVGLDGLGQSADGLKLVYLKLSVQGANVGSIERTKNLTHLEEISLSDNKITDLTPLSHLKFLVRLDVSHNQLKSVLDFSPPPALQEANFSYNPITEIPDLSAHRFLRKLNLEGCMITQITGLSALSCLRELNLARNKITKLSGLDGLTLLRLNLSGNGITRIEGLITLSSLEILDLSENTIESLIGIEAASRLQDFSVSRNKISDLSELDHLIALFFLSKLKLSGNPVEEKTGSNYRAEVVYRVSNITELDGLPVPAEEKVAAKNLHAADVIARKNIEQKVFPDGYSSFSESS